MASAVYLSLLSLLLLPQVSFQQATTSIKQVVEGLNTNIDILCDLDRELHPVYWKIQEQVYDQYGLPDVFTLRGHEAINLAMVDRRMDGWRLQCFSVDHTRLGGLHPGIITMLQVIVINNDTNIETANPLQPSLRGKLTFHFQDLQIQPDILTIGWLYPPDPSSATCTASTFRIDIYSEGQISNVATQRDLVPDSSYSVSSSQLFLLHLSTMLLPNFFRISHQETTCPRSGYFYNLRFNDSTPDIHVSEPTASFEIPEHLLNNRSVQLIWSKDASTQCVCPPVRQFMDTCACNIRHPSNLVTIVSNTLTVSNIQEMDEEGITLYFVSSTSGGCHGFCNLRYIVRKQRIIVTQGFPSPPALNFTTDDTFCFTIPNNPISAEVYEVNLTDITGSQTRLSGVYNTSHCLNITSDLYPESCGPFQLSVMAINSVGRASTIQTIYAMQEPNLCQCYKKREKLSIQNVRPSSNSVEFNVLCVDEAILMINTTGGYRMSVACNSTVTPDSNQLFVPSTNYSIFGISVETETLCLLNQFRTNNNNGNGAIIATIVITIIGVVIIIILCIIISLSLYRNQQCGRNKLESNIRDESNRPRSNSCPKSNGEEFTFNSGAKGDEEGKPKPRSNGEEEKPEPNSDAKGDEEGKPKSNRPRSNSLPGAKANKEGKLKPRSNEGEEKPGPNSDAKGDEEDKHKFSRPRSNSGAKGQPELSRPRSNGNGKDDY